MTLLEKNQSAGESGTRLEHDVTLLANRFTVATITTSLLTTFSDLLVSSGLRQIGAREESGGESAPVMLP
jgi:hypothetical protein